MLGKIMGFYEQFINGLHESISCDFGGKKSRLAKAAGTHPSTLARIVDEERSTWLKSICDIADAAGLTVKKNISTIAARSVCWVDAKVVPSGNGLPAPEHEDYLAVPLVDECGAGPGIIPQGDLLSWFLVWRHQDAIRGKTDLIAVRIAKGSDSMVPTLSPGDIVLVDKQDKGVAQAGHIMLVMDPDGSGKIKRVSAQHMPKDKDYRITYYSDNAAEYPPEVYSLAQDYDNDWHKAIVGRAIWAWSDISRR